MEQDDFSPASLAYVVVGVSACMFIFCSLIINSSDFEPPPPPTEEAQPSDNNSGRILQPAGHALLEDLKPAAKAYLLSNHPGMAPSGWMATTPREGLVVVSVDLKSSSGQTRVDLTATKERGVWVFRTFKSDDLSAKVEAADLAAKQKEEAAVAKAEKEAAEAAAKAQDEED